MKKNYLKILIGVIAVLLTYFIVRSIMFEANLEYKTPLEFNSNNIIKNYSNTEYADTIAHIGLNYLNVKDEEIIILDANKNILSQMLPNERVMGFVIKEKHGVYTIYLDPSMSRSRMINVLSHELIHIQQKSSHRLTILDTELAIFEGDTILIKKTEYRDRPWEREAYQDEKKVEWYIKKIIF